MFQRQTRMFPNLTGPLAGLALILSASGGAHAQAIGDLFAFSGSDLPHDLSPWGMFMNADIVVKGVMIGLAFASVVTWTVLIVKLVEIWGANRNAREVAGIIARAADLPDGPGSMSPTPAGGTPTPPNTPGAGAVATARA